MKWKMVPIVLKRGRDAGVPRWSHNTINVGKTVWISCPDYGIPLAPKPKPKIIIHRRDGRKPIPEIITAEYVTVKVDPTPVAVPAQGRISGTSQQKLDKNADTRRRRRQMQVIKEEEDALNVAAAGPLKNNKKKQNLLEMRNAPTAAVWKDDGGTSEDPVYNGLTSSPSSDAPDTERKWSINE